MSDSIQPQKYTVAFLFPSSIEDASPPLYRLVAILSIFDDLRPPQDLNLRYHNILQSFSIHRTFLKILHLFSLSPTSS